MSSTAFPTTLADVEFEEHLQTDLYKTLRSLRKSTLSIPNRLISILSDARFVETLHHSLAERYPSYSWPLIANERCGSWYIPPTLKSGSAYFKSTDGHYGQWDFSLRRLNLPLLEMLGHNGGAVLIDSTRRGKKFPDALLRTIPIWAAVWNRVLFPEECGVGAEHENADISRLQANGLEASEISQIESRLPNYINRLHELQLDLERLRKMTKKPLLCHWVTNSTDPSLQVDRLCEDIMDIDGKQDYNLLILCSASRRVEGAEMSEEGYIQGAGDDSEGWSCDLTAQLFWRHKDELLTTPEEKLPESIENLLELEKSEVHYQQPILIKPTSNLFIGMTNSNHLDESESQGTFDICINCNTKLGDVQSKTTSVHLSCRTGKLGSKDLRGKLKDVSDFVKSSLKNKVDPKMLVTCDTGRDLSVGIAVTLLCLMYNDEGQLDAKRAEIPIDKQFIKRRLAWITSSKPDANPSRATLQAVNSFLMARPD